MAPASDGAGWKSNPLVGIVAIVLIAIAAIVGFTCARSTPDLERPSSVPEQKGIVLICPDCQHQFTLLPEQIAGESNAPLDARAAATPCPKCGKTNCQAAVRCVHCGKYVLPVFSDTPVGGRQAHSRGGGGAAGPRCPKCGKDPFTK